MSGIKIPVTVDLVSNLSEQVKREAEKTKTGLNNGSLGLNTSDDIKQVNALNSAVQKLKTAITDANKQGVDITSVDSGSALSEYQGAIEAIAEAQKKLGKTSVSPDVDRALKEAKAYRRELSAIDKSLKRINSAKQFSDKVAGRAASPAEREAIAGHLARSRNSIVRNAINSGDDFEAAVRRAIPDKKAADALLKHQAQTARVGTGIGLEIDPATGGARNAGSGMPPMRGVSRFAGAAGAAMGGMLAGAGDGGVFGSLGRMAGTGIGMGAGAMIGGPAGAVAGAGIAGLLTSALGGIGQKIDQAMSDALQEGIDTSRLRHTLGDASIEFGRLRDKTRLAAEGMGISYTESIKYAKQFTKTGNLSGRDGAEGLDGELKNAYGFSKSTGIDAGASVDFFAKMRLAGVTDDEKGSRKIGLAVADAIAAGGGTAKSDEVLSAISGFAQQATRMSLGGSPDVSAYASMMAAGTSQKVAGMDVAGTSSMMGRMDASVRSGGTFGDPSRLFMMQALGGDDRNMSIYDAKNLMQGGMFGTKAGRFGGDSLFMKHAVATGDNAAIKKGKLLSSGADANKTNLSRIMEALKREAPSSEARIAMLANLTQGGDQDQARAIELMAANDPGGSRLQERMKRLKIDPGKVANTAVGGLAELENGDASVLEKYKERLLKGDGFKKATAEEAASIKGASGDSEALRDVLVKMVASRGTQETAGEKALQVQTDLKDKLTEFAGHMMPATTKIQEAMLALVTKLAPDSDYAKEIKAKKEEEAAKASVGKIDESIAAANKTINDPNATKEQKDAARRMLGHLETAKKAEVENYEKKHGKLLFAGKDADKDASREAPAVAADQARAAKVKMLRDSMATLDKPSTEEESATGERKEKLKKMREAGKAQIQSQIDAAEGNKPEARSSAIQGKNGADMKAARESAESDPSRPFVNDREKRQLASVKLSDSEQSALNEATGGDAKANEFLTNILKVENRGKSSVDNNAVSPVGAAGAFQFMPKTASSLGLSNEGRFDFKQSSAAAYKLYKDLYRQHGGDLDKMYAGWNGSPSLAKLAGRSGNKENDDYVRYAQHLRGAKPEPMPPDAMTPMPKDALAVRDRAREKDQIEFSHTFSFMDPRGQQIASPIVATNTWGGRSSASPGQSS